MTKAKKTESGGMIGFFKRHPIIKHLLLATAFLISILLLTMLWLNIYTNHGQKIEMPDFNGMNYNNARKEAQKRTFEMIVNDSVFIIGKEGGLVLKQNPIAGAEVKENRKVYVTVSKYNADRIKLRDLPTLYGNDYSQKKTELGYRGIESSIKDRKYDPGAPNHILEVYYNGEKIIDKDTDPRTSSIEIEKGSTLEFVISDKGGGEVEIPEVVCLTLAEAEFLIEQSKLTVGRVIETGIIEDRLSAYIIAQNPPFDGSSKLGMGESIGLTISMTKPSQCN